MDILNQILDGISFGFLVFAVSAAAASVYFTVAFFKNRKALKGKNGIADTERRNHCAKRRRMIIFLIVFALMADLTLSAFILRGAADEFGYLLNPIHTVSKKNGVVNVSLNQYKVSVGGSESPQIKRGSIENGKTSTFSFTAESTGSYLFRFTKMSDGMEIKINLRDRGGNNVDYAGNVKNKSEVPMDNVKKGVRYTVTLTAMKGGGEYEIEMIPPKNFEIKHYTHIKDSVEYNYQSNVYYFTPLDDGVYCFSLTGIKDGCKIGINVKEADTLLFADNGLAIVVLSAGKEYRINVNQLKGQSSYTLNVMRQKPVVDISSATEVNDSFEFWAQHNYYSFTGKTEITLNIETNGIQMSLFVNDEDENVIYNKRNFRGYKTVTVDGLSADKTYYVLIFTTENTGKYKFSVE